ncbi:RHS repeat-associated core domain-containing protein [Pseudomonas sp. MN1F]|uniref:RHS repeat-associated core domain-containing protein n=1 Tax=Pseudomonas sp. MN1F TaxID=1366632 RepID=UPI0015B5B011|nr:RHS repeat protein [Pseudomonas sp. MN1F]
MHNAALATLHARTPDAVARSSLDMPLMALRLLRSADDALARWLRTRTEVDLLMRTARVFGARALRVAPGSPLLPDSSTVVRLDGQPLKLHTADGDSTLTLIDSAGRPLWAQNAQQTCTTVMYEAASEGGRPRATFEQAAGDVARQRERILHATIEAANRSRNLAGSPIEQFDNAGVTQIRSRSLTDQVLETRRHLLRAEAGLPDWAGDSENELETSPWLMTARHDATGAVLQSTNAADVATLTTYEVSGEVCQILLRDAKEQAVVLKDIQRRADGKLLSQTAGNDVVDTYAYSPTTHRLNRHLTARPASHRQGQQVICDLHYHHDPVGNLLSLDDQGADPLWFRNRQVSGLREFGYDSLYRLASATGRERAAVSGIWSAAFSAADRQGGRIWIRYSERYAYDDGDNLTTLDHSSGWRSRKLIVSSRSNRALPQGHDLLPDTGFLPGGLQKQLADGRPLEWLADNQLRQVRLVVRDGGDADDTERYHYADGGTRTRKVTTATTASGRQTTITTYLEGCEIRQRWLDRQALAQKHVVISETSGARWVHDRLNGKVHLRYAFSDHLGSVGGETDQDGKLANREEYSPFGETTGLDEAAEEVDGLTQRTARYCAKELDASGLYCYGSRYCERGRWVSADPGGTVDGINLYRMVRNNPLRYRDETGLNAQEATPPGAPGNSPPNDQTSLPDWLDPTRPEVVLSLLIVAGTLALLGFVNAIVPPLNSLKFAWRDGNSLRVSASRVRADLSRQLSTRTGIVDAIELTFRALTLAAIIYTAVQRYAYGNMTEAGRAGVVTGALAIGTTAIPGLNRLYGYCRDPGTRRSRRPIPPSLGSGANSGQMPDNLAIAEQPNGSTYGQVSRGPTGHLSTSSHTILTIEDTEHAEYFELATQTSFLHGPATATQNDDERGPLPPQQPSHISRSSSRRSRSRSRSPSPQSHSTRL